MPQFKFQRPSETAHTRQRRHPATPSSKVPRRHASELLEPRLLLTGTGLRGEYFAEGDLTDLQLIRLDGNIDFDWQHASPDPLLPADHFSARWTGQIEPPSSQTYTFHTLTDDGARLWIDGRLLIDAWGANGSNETSATIALDSGRRYDPPRAVAQFKAAQELRSENQPWVRGNWWYTPLYNGGLDATHPPDAQLLDPDPAAPPSSPWQLHPDDDRTFAFHARFGGYTHHVVAYAQTFHLQPRPRPPRHPFPRLRRQPAPLAQRRADLRIPRLPPQRQRPRQGHAPPGLEPPLREGRQRHRPSRTPRHILNGHPDP